MNKPLWALAGVVLLGTAGVAGGIIVASSGGEEEAVQQVETATLTASANASPTAPTATATTAPSATPLASESPAPAPEGWVTYTDPERGFSFPHPADLTVSVHPFELPAAQGHARVSVRTLSFQNSAGVSAISLFVAPNPDNLTVEQWLETYPGCCSGKPQPVTIDGEPGLRFPEDALDTNPTILFKHNAFLYGLTGFVSSIPESGATPILGDADFQQVAEGFRFGS